MINVEKSKLENNLRPLRSLYHPGLLPHPTVKKPACYNALMLPDIRVDDVVRLRKPHPCGGYEWKIVRLGADIGLQCLICGRRVLLTRRELARRLKKIITPHIEQTIDGQS